MSEMTPQTMMCMEVWGGNSLTSSSVSMSGLDAWVYSRPFQSAEEGGDVYYVSSCATGRITRLLVADVSGHGSAVCDSAGALRNLMRRYVNHLDQRHFVRSMNRQFVEFSQAEVFATAVVTTFFGPTNYLTLCNAGHPTPLLYRAKTKRWTLLERGDNTLEGLSNIPLGIDDICDYEQVGVQLDVNDLVLCYSDSLIESHDADGNMLGELGLLTVANELTSGDPAKVIDALLANIAARHDGNLAHDDVTVLLFRPNGTSKPTTLSEKLAEAVRVVGGVAKALVRREPLPLPDFNLANLGGSWFRRLNHGWRGGRHG